MNTQVLGKCRAVGERFLTESTPGKMENIEIKISNLRYSKDDY